MKSVFFSFCGHQDILVELVTYRIWENIRRGKHLHFEWKMASNGKTFAITLLYIYIANWQGHNLQEKIRDWMKNCENHKSFPQQMFCCVQYTYVCI